MGVVLLEVLEVVVSELALFLETLEERHRIDHLLFFVGPYRTLETVPLLDKTVSGRGDAMGLKHLIQRMEGQEMS